MNFSSVSIRDYTEQDMIVHDEYFLSATPEYLYDLGVDVVALKKMMSERSGVRTANFEIPVRQRSLHNYAVEIDNKLVGIAIFKGIKLGEEAHLHAHIFSLSNRKRGIASAVFIAVIKTAFETFDLQKIICEPTITNIGPNAVLQKMGLKILDTYEKPAEGVLRARTSNRYEITREVLG